MRSDLLDKITSYNLFNYLLPGAAFAFVATEVLGFHLIQDNVLIAAFLYYFLGVLVSRFGSLVLEPLLKKTGLVRFQPYDAYANAERVDPKIPTLMEAANMYRTLAALFLLLLCASVYRSVELAWPLLESYRAPIACLAGVALFVISYVKQVRYVAARVSAANKKD